MKRTDIVHRSLENIKVRWRLLPYIFIYLAVIKSLIIIAEAVPY